MEIIDTIKLKLTALDEDFDSLKKFMQDYLVRIETSISEKEILNLASIQSIRDTSFSVSTIAKELECSRTTLYNHNQLLKRYIEHSEALFNKDNPYYSIESLRSTVALLREQIDQMEVRDVTIEELRFEKEEMVKIIKERDKEIKRLRIRVNELSKDLYNTTQLTTSNQSKKIVPFK